MQLPELEKNKKVCIALSGGLDSTVLTALLVKTYGPGRVLTMGFNFGQRHQNELQSAAVTAQYLKVPFTIINLNYLGEITKNVCSLIEASSLTPETNDIKENVSTYVPFRNLQFAAITAAFAESNDCKYIFQGINAVDQYGYWDTTTEFMNAVNDILKLSNSGIEFVAPFVNLTKKDEVLLAKGLSEYFGFDILRSTWSCYRGKQKEFDFKECGLVGRCNTCMEKLKAYVEAGISDDVILNTFAGDQESLDHFKHNLELELPS